jgi:hypothetical protein
MVEIQNSEVASEQIKISPSNKKRMDDYRLILESSNNRRLGKRALYISYDMILTRMFEEIESLKAVLTAGKVSKI